MVQTKIISKANFLKHYAENNITEVFVINISGEQRIYGKTTLGEGHNIDGYVVVYAVI